MKFLSLINVVQYFLVAADGKLRVTHSKLRVTEIAEMTFTVNGDEIGLISIGLFGEIVPKTVRNFRKLCSGWTSGGKYYSYAGSPVHEISFFYRIGMGDVTSGVGHQSEDTGGISIFGKKFDDENFELNHVGRGWLSMDNWGENSNKSSFYILLSEAEFMDNLHVVFGKVMTGSSVLDLLEEQPTHAKTDEEYDEPVVPDNEVMISKCVVKVVDKDDIFETLEELNDDDIVVNNGIKDEL